MDKFVQRTTYRRAPKRSYEHTELSKVKSCSDVEVVEIKETLVNPGADTVWRRCDSITESCHKDGSVEASPNKRKKLERSWSPIKPQQTLATIDEYPTLEAAAKNKRKTRSRSITKQVEPKNDDVQNQLQVTEDEVISLNSDVSLYDLSLDFGNKSWADLVMEEEQEQEGQKQKDETESKQQPADSRKKKERVRFKEDTALSQTVGESLKFESKSSSRRSSRAAKSPETDARTGNKSSVWQNRLRASPPSKALSARPPPKSPRRRRNDVEDASTRSTWRRRPLLDEDSQNTLTEVARITKATPQFRMSQPQHDGPAVPPVSKRPDYYLEPKHGWETDPAVLERREKDIQKGYNSDVYKQYIKLIDKKKRIKGLHPKTPNKHLKMPRRSWDTQVRVWRRLLYTSVDVDIPSDASFVSSSNCSETTSEHDMTELKLDVDDDATTTLLMANVADESTLKAAISMDVDAEVKGPTDFATLSADISNSSRMNTRRQLRTN